MEEFLFSYPCFSFTDIISKNYNDKILSNYKICLAIPNSVKHILWFYSFKNEHFVLFIEYDEITKKIAINIPPYRFIRITTSILDDTIVLGTIFSSSTKKEFNFFIIEDIFTFQGNNLSQKTFGEKLFYINELLILQNIIKSSNLIIQLVLPFFWEKEDKIPFLMEEEKIVPNTIVSSSIDVVILINR